MQEQCFSATGRDNLHKRDTLSLPVAAAVFAGATVLVGLPVMVLTLVLFEMILGVVDSIGATGVSAAVTLPVLLSVLAGVQAAYETTALRLHGMGALHRGSRLTVLVRHSLLGLYVLAVLAALTRFAWYWVPRDAWWQASVRCLPSLHCGSSSGLPSSSPTGVDGKPGELLSAPAKQPSARRYCDRLPYKTQRMHAAATLD